MLICVYAYTYMCRWKEWKELLAFHWHLNLTAGGVIDFMHCIFFGVVYKTLTTLWLDDKYQSKPFRIKNKKRIIVCLLNTLIHKETMFYSEDIVTNDLLLSKCLMISTVLSRFWNMSSSRKVLHAWTQYTSCTYTMKVYVVSVLT